MELDDFQDTKYSTAQHKGSHPNLFEYKPIKILTLTLWNIILDISVMNGYKYLCSCTCNTDVKFMVAVKIVYKNNIPEAKEICEQKSGQTPLSLLFSEQKTGYRLNGTYTIWVHVLMARPTQ